MSTDNENRYLSALGARLLSEANNLKRTPEVLAAGIAFDLETVEAVINGHAGADTAEAVVRAMAETHPISLANLWVEPDDTDGGLVVMRTADSADTARVYERKDRTGGHTPYYEYRDATMSRTAPFKPEWIKQLRVVDDADLDNPDVAYNNGHLMHQCTFFVGEVNFYWQIGNRNGYPFHQLSVYCQFRRSPRPGVHFYPTQSRALQHGGRSRPTGADRRGAGERHRRYPGIPRILVRGTGRRPPVGRLRDTRHHRHLGRQPHHPHSSSNNIHYVDESTARRIARAALEYFCPVEARKVAVNL